jgi:hypothetical protein
MMLGSERDMSFVCAGQCLSGEAERRQRTSGGDGGTPEIIRGCVLLPLGDMVLSFATVMIGGD